MLNLVLIRHAHAGPHIEPDIKRQLSQRGELEAQQAAQVIKYSSHLPGTWLVSSAARTQQTADILLANNQNLLSERKNELKWYEAGGLDYLNFIELESCTTIYLIAHNPSISYVASYLSNTNIFMETGSIVHLQWETLEHWTELTKASAFINYHFDGKQQ